MILHVDMDAFDASIEERDDPRLVGRPVIVGGTPQQRGVVAAANYEVRRFGVHSAMPTATAMRLCPQAIVLPVRMQHYADVSGEIRAILERYTQLIEPLSLDEAFLDVTGSEPLFGSAETIGRRIKADIRREVRLVASVGVAPNKFLAKVASDLEKPDGFFVVRPDAVQQFLDPLPVGRLWGVGRVIGATSSGWESTRSASCAGYQSPHWRSCLVVPAANCGGWPRGSMIARWCPTARPRRSRTHARSPAAVRFGPSLVRISGRVGDAGF